MTEVVFASLPLAAIAFGESLGTSRGDLLTLAGLDDGDLSDPDGFVAYDRLLALWDGMVARFPGRPLGMEYGDQLPLSVAGIVGQVCAHAATVGGALQAHLRFNRLLDPRLEVALDGEAPVYRLTFAYRLTNPCIPEILEMLVTTTLRFARTLTDAAELGPYRVCFAHPQRHPLATYEERVRCPAEFDAPWTGIEFDAAFLEAPMTTGQPDVQRYLAKHAESLLAARPRRGASLSDRVRAHIESKLSNGPPSAEEVAAAVGVSARTLQRRLADDGTSLSDVIDAERRRQALHMLRTTDLTAQQIAFMLGYSEPRAFHRAFKRWSGTSPGLFRRGHGGS